MRPGRWAWIVSCAELAAIALIYLLTAKLSLRFASINPSATPIWPPTGLALGLMLLRGYRVWPAILAGAIAANVATSGWISLAIGAGNTLEALAGAWLVNALAGGVRAFRNPVGVAKFAAVVCAGATPISATIGVLSLTLGGHVEPANSLAVWTTWWLGDLAGGLVVAPVLVLWVSDPPRLAKPYRPLLETVLVVMLAVAVGLLALGPAPRPVGAVVLAFLAVLPLLLGALRGSERDTMTAAVILSGFAVWGTAAGSGPFVQPTLNDSFLLLVAFVVAAAVPGLALSSAIGERDRAEQAAQLTLERTREQLLQAQKLEALGQLTGGVAHDFNNLLMVVGGQADILSRNLRDEGQLRSLDAIKAAVARGSSLTRQLLSFARRRTPAPEAIDLARRLGAMRGVLKSSLGEAIGLELDLTEGLGEAIWPVEVDVHELELAILNLVVNARDAMPEGGDVRIRVRNLASAGKGGGPGEFVEISVSDTGVGMTAEVLAKAADPFFTTKPVGKGTGLGLSQAHGFATQSGGDLSLVSQPGAGCRATLRLPRSARPAEVAARRRGRDPAPAAGLVLLVEDNPDVAEAITAMLRSLGYGVVAAADGAAALRRLDEGGRFDLVLSDIVMPGAVDGLTLAGRLRERRPELPIVLATGYSQAAETPAGVEILHKPFDLDILATALAAARGRAASADAATPA